jgi:hypothetical protein
MSAQDPNRSSEAPPSGLGIGVERTDDRFTIVWRGRGMLNLRSGTAVFTICGILILLAYGYGFLREVWQGAHPNPFGFAKVAAFGLAILAWSWWLGRLAVSFEFDGTVLRVSTRAPLYRSTRTFERAAIRDIRVVETFGGDFNGTCTYLRVNLRDGSEYNCLSNSYPKRGREWIVSALREAMKLTPPRSADLAD